nr:MBL fold metallo-hydrolase [Rhizobium sp. SSA_523]
MDGDWGACDPSNPRNRRLRAALLVEQIAADGAKTTVVIDTGPDFREQMIAAGVTRIDSILFTHAHADHLHGIDDVRGYFHAQRMRIPIYADLFTMNRIRQGFGYCLETPPGGNYPPIVEPRLIKDLSVPIRVEGPGGVIEFQAHQQQHGDIGSLGFRIGDVAYCTDVSDFPAQAIEALRGLDVLIIDALQYRPHPSHLSLEQALVWIDRLSPKRAILTHMHIPLDYQAVMDETPEHVQPAYDGLTIEVDV